MKSKLAFNLKDEYLLLRITGTYDHYEFMALPELIKARCDKEKIYKVLLMGLDLKASDLSTTDKYFLGERFALELGKKVAIAVVWPAEYIDKFAETVAQNRGGQLFVTGDIKSAEEWLRKEEIQ